MNTMTKPDVPNANHWVATKAKVENAKTDIIWIECERFFDARNVARTLLGDPDAIVTRLDHREVAPNRVQVRWTGTASELKLQIRRVKMGKPDSWKNLR